MKPTFRLSAISPTKKIVTGVLLVLAVGVALFDWNWLRGPLERYVSEKSAREVRIGHLHVTLGLTLEATVRLRDLYVENAPWAGKQPMAVAGEASFTFSLKSIAQRRPVISRLVLRDADVDLQRQADGLRNWRLINPDNRGPGRIRVMTLEAHRSKIHFVNREIDFEVAAAASPLGAATDNASPPDALSNRIDIKGKFRGEKFAGEALTGALLSFRDSGMWFPMRGHLGSGKTRIEFDGTFADLFDLGGMDAKVRLAGPSLSKLHPLVDFRPAVSRPYAFQAQVTLREKNYTFAGLQGKIGETDLAGEATYNRDADRPLLRAALRSASANLWDLASLVGVSHRLDATSAQKAAEPQESDSGVAAAEPGSAGRIFPARPIRAERLKIIDAHVTMDAKKLNTPGMPALESLRFAAALENGALQLNTIDLGVAGGHAVGTLAFNGQHQPPSSSAAIDVRNVRLEKLFPSLPAKAQSTGVIRAQIKLSGQGNSIAAIIGSATGSLAAVMDRGRISNLLDAKLALDGGKILGSLIRGERDIALNCAAVAFDIRKGVGKSQFIMLDTEQTHVDGIATLNLRAERFELVLTPQPKNPGLFTLRSSIKGEGSFRRARFSVDKRVAVDHAGRAAAPATLNALLRPLVESGRSGDGTCGAFLGAKPTVRNAAAAIE